MQCSACGGHVTWRGPLSNLTHTECAGCGRQNSQLPEGDGYYDDEGCIECDWGQRPCHCTGTPYGVDYEDGAEPTPPLNGASPESLSVSQDAISPSTSTSEVG